MVCASCGATEWRRRRALPRLTVLTCAGCGLLASEIDAIGAINYADIDDAEYDAAIGSLRQRQAIDAVRFVLPHVPAGAWLDIGCGPGLLLAEAARVGFQVSGVEPDANAASLARSRVGNDAVRQDVLREAETRSVNVISTMDVLEHVPVAQLSDFANIVRQSLRDDGVWLIKVPSTDGLYFRIAHAFSMNRPIERLWQVDYQSPHTVYFREATLRRFLERHGFEVIAERYVRELPLRHAFGRLTMRGTTSRWLAFLSLPAIAAINFIESVRRKSDALMLIARAK